MVIAFPFIFQMWGKIVDYYMVIASSFIFQKWGKKLIITWSLLSHLFFFPFWFKTKTVRNFLIQKNAFTYPCEMQLPMNP